MRFLFLGVLLCALSSVMHAQDGLQPRYDISPNIAKIPERGDFSGAWTRSDGGYRIDVGVDLEKEAVVVQYFNPEPINVESSIFDVLNNEPLLTFVLRDQGYPGSSYQLTFLPERRVLIGTYTRPGSEPSQVYFVKEGE